MWIAKAYKDYTVHKQTYKELSEKYGKSHKTLRKHFDEFSSVTGELKLINKPVVLILDATFFGRGYGILLARTPEIVLLWEEIVSETVQVYSSFLDSLEAAEYTFSGFVIDGRRGVRKLLERRFPQIPIQFCQFHQIQIVKRYIPRKAQITYQNKPASGMPNTTNHCDGLFSHIKQKVLIHRGISKQRRKKMIDYMLENF